MLAGSNDGGSTGAVAAGEGAAWAAPISALAGCAEALAGLGDDCAAAEVAETIARMAIKKNRKLIKFIASTAG